MILAEPAHAQSKVTLCHRTDSETNPYVVITVSVSGAYHGHYREHEGDVWYSGHPKEPKWGDIIPPFTYRGQTYQLNWNAAGQAIFNAGCVVPTTATSSAPSTTTPTRTHTHTPPPRRTTPPAATSTAATSTAATTAAAGTGTTSSSTTSAAAVPVVERSFLGEQIVAAPNGQAGQQAHGAGGAHAAAAGAGGPIPAGANAGLAAVQSGSGDAPLWAEVTLFGAAAAAAAGAVTMTRRRRRSH